MVFRCRFGKRRDQKVLHTLNELTGDIRYIVTHHLGNFADGGEDTVVSTTSQKDIVSRYVNIIRATYPVQYIGTDIAHFVCQNVSSHVG